jgi:Uma2 family endonuclease
MMLEILNRPSVARPLSKALRNGAKRSGNGLGGEERLIISGLSWKAYEQLDSALGHNRPGPRLYFLDGELEIMTTSLKHERLKEWLGTLVEDFLYDAGMETFPHGQATLRLLSEAGAEPDKSWCLGQEKEHPDLVVEIALTSGGLDKLEIYRRFAIQEVWFWRKQRLEAWSLRRDGSAYVGPAPKSRLLPALDLPLLSRCLQMPTWRQARRAFRQSWQGNTA